MKLSDLHEEYIERANRSMNMGKLPIDPKEPETPILPSNRWMKSENTLVKTYTFRRWQDRERFVIGLFAYESKVEHNAEMLIKQYDVTVMVRTENIGVTELDYEYARFSDGLYKDVVYSLDHARENDQTR